METQNLEGNSLGVRKSSYRTYEEWKLSMVLHRRTQGQSSYRTYEEWKHALLQPFQHVWVEFLPYLWGMETSFHSAKQHLRL